MLEMKMHHSSQGNLIILKGKFSLLAVRAYVNFFSEWEAGNTSKLTTSDTVVNHKKRKRSVLE